MQAAIVSVGSEILRGTLLDTNAQYFAHELTTIGIEVVRVTQAPDDLKAITSVLSESMRVADVIVVSGGLGPTEDDLTREAIIELTGESPSVDAATVEAIRARFASRGDQMPERNIKQAWTIPSATAIPNPHGTAPGWLVNVDERVIAVLPGPPRENRPMWELKMRPLIVPLASDQAIISRTIKTIGIGESAVADALDELISRDWPVIGTYAKSDGVHVSVTAAHHSRAAADAAVRACIADAVDALAPHVYGYGDDTLAGAVVQPLLAAGVQMGICEFGSAGALSSLLMEDPEAERAVAWSRLQPLSGELAAHHSGLDLARDVARRHARNRDLGTIAVVVLKSERADGITSSGDVGLALAHAGGLRARSHGVTGTAAEQRRRAGLLAAEFLWRELKAAAGLPTGPGRSNRTSRTASFDQP